MIVVLSFFVVLFPTELAAQGEAAVPFLLISSSPDGNGWGGMGTAVAFDNPMATIANPAQLGLFGMRNFFSASTYTEKTDWLKLFNVPNLNYNVYGLSLGVNLAEQFEFPLPVSIGAGYSHIRLNLGDFIRTNSSGQEIGRFSAFETSEQFSVGVGLDVHAKLSIGWNFKKIVSSLSPIGTAMEIGAGRAEPSATDFGLMAQFPVFDIAAALSDSRVTITSIVEPLLDFTFGYARSNMGDKVKYIEAAQTDPLPRNATIGLSVELGFVTKVNERKWKILTFTLAREAADLLIVRKPGGTIEYQSGLGDIAFFKHVVRGELSDDDRANLHKGWQFNFGEIVYLRGGSFSESPNFGNRNYSTSGFGLHLNGIFKLIDAVSASPIESDVLAFIRDHIDIQYDHAGYSDHEILGGTKFNALNLVIR